MGAAENRAKSAAQAAFMKERGITRTTAKCPWGCGGLYSTSPSGGGSGASLMNHLNGCQGGGAKKRNRLVQQGWGRR